MTFLEATQTQEPWLIWWMNWLLVFGIILPSVLVFWRDTRRLGLYFFFATLAMSITVLWLYNLQGYTRLLGVPHIIIWVPGVYLMWAALKRDILPLPRAIIWVAMITLTISLAFDISDAVRFALGDRGSLIPG